MKLLLVRVTEHALYANIFVESRSGVRDVTRKLITLPLSARQLVPRKVAFK
jgi:hypothetical protein